MAEPRTVLSNKYELVRLIGRGGMGEVWEARHVHIHAARAIKLLRSDLAHNPEIIKRFLGEGKRMAALSHPSIVAIHDQDTDPARGPYLVMQLIRGRDLGKIIQEHGALPYSEVIRIGRQIAEALDCAHRNRPRSIIHRDIKPANVLIDDETGRAVVTDFGIAKEILSDEDDATHTELTATEEYLGTFRYSAPEQLRNEKALIDGRADIYSLGVVMYEMCSGRRFLEGLSKIEMAIRIGSRDTWEPVLAFPDDTPDAFRMLVRGCLARELGQRIASARLLIERLSECGATPEDAAGVEPDMTVALPRAVTSSSVPTGAAPDTREVEPEAQPEHFVPAIPVEPDETTVARLRDMIQSVCQQVEERLVELERLQAEAAHFGVAGDDSELLNLVPGRLAEIEQATSRDDLRAALALAETFNERVLEATRQLEEKLRSTVEQSFVELRAQRNDLLRDAGEFVPSETIAALDRALARGQGSLEVRNWTGCRQRLSEARQLVAQSSGAARQRVEELIRPLLAETDRIAQGVIELAPEMGAQGLADELRAAVASDLQSGRLLAARARAEEGVARLRQLRRDIEAERIRKSIQQLRARADEVDRCLETIQGADATVLVFPGWELDEREVSDDQALAALEQHGDRLVRLQREREDSTRRLVNEEIESLAAAWLNLQKGAGSFLDGHRTSSFDQHLHSTRTALANEEWEQAGVGISRARVLLDAAVKDARSSAEQALRSSFAELEHGVHQIRVRQPVPESLRPELIRKRIESALDNGAFADASNLVQGALAEITSLSQRLAREEGEQVAAARAACEKALTALELETARSLASEETAAGLAAREAGEKAVARGELSAALALFAEAHEAFLAARTRVADIQARQRQAALDALRELLADVGKQVEAFAGGAIASAKRALERAPSLPHADALALLGKSHSVLAAAHAAAPLFAAAETERQRASALARSVSALALGPAERKACEEVMAAAAAAFEHQQWTEACERYRQAADLWKRLEEGAIERQQAERQGQAARLVREVGDVIATLTELEHELDDLGGAPPDARHAQRLLGELKKLEEQTRAEPTVQALTELAALRDRTLGVKRERQSARDALAAERRRQVRSEAERVKAECEQLYGQLDWAAAERLPGSVIKEIRSLRDRGQRAFEQEDYTGAIAAYVKALSGLKDISGKVQELQQAERLAVVRELRVLLEQAEPEPEEIIGDARSECTAALQHAETQPHAGAMASLEAARTRLSTARAEVPLYLEASARRAAAERLSADARDLDRRARKQLNRATKKAASAFDGRRWQEATAHYDEVVQLLDRVEQTVVVPSPALTVPPRRFLPLAAGMMVVASLIAVAWWQVGSDAPSLVERPPDQAEERAERIEPPAEPVVAPEPPAADVVAEVEKPIEVAAAVPLIPRIVSAEPADERIQLVENSKQAFTVKVEGQAETSPALIRWLLDDAPVAENTASWEYAPGFDAAAGKPRRLEVRLGDGKEENQVKAWTIEIGDVNRSPRVVKAVPPVVETVKKEVGERVSFKVQAADDDGDGLRYEWRVDGKPAGGDAPEMAWKIQGDHRVEVSIGDGKTKEPLSVGWKIAAVEPFRFEAKPAKLSTLRFKETQELRLQAPASSSGRIDYEWTVDGRKLGDSDRIRFAADDPRLVRGNPVTIAVTATDAEGRTYSHEWKPKILPPAPRIVSASPSDRSLDAEPGSSQPFDLVVADPVGNQSYTYVYERDGNETRQSASRFELKATAEPEQRLAVYVVDNYGQRSESATWTIRASDITRLVRLWLDQLRSAFDRKDLTTLAGMLQLSAEQRNQLARALESQSDLKVSFNNLKIDKSDATSARATYQRVDDFRDPNGNRRSMSSKVEQRFQLERGRVLLDPSR